MARIRPRRPCRTDGSGAGPRAWRAEGPWLFLALLALGVLVAPLSPGAGHAQEGSERSATVDLASIGPEAELMANASESATSGTVPAQVSFVGSASGGLPPYNFTWSFGDGTTGYGSEVQHTYSTAGTYSVLLTVRDAAGDSVQTSLSFSATSSPGLPPGIDYLLVGAAVAAVVGVVVGVFSSRRTTSPVDDSGAPEPNLILASWREKRVAMEGPPVQGPPSMYAVHRGAPEPSSGGTPGPLPPAGLRAAPPSYAPSSDRAPTGAPSPYPTAGRTLPPTAPAPASPAAPTPAPVVYGQGPSVWRAPPATWQAQGVRAAHPGPSAPMPATPLSSMRAEATVTPPGVAALLPVSLGGGAPVVDGLEALNALPWSQIEQEAMTASPADLARAVAKLDPMVREVRRLFLDPERLRPILRDLTQDWFRRSSAATPPPAGPSGPSEKARLLGLLAASEDGETRPLLERMGRTTGNLAWRALLRSSPMLMLIFAVFVFVEVAAFFTLDLAYRGALLTPAVSLIVPAAVLGPPALILALYPVGEWGHLMWTRLRHHDAESRLYALPQVRLVSYVLVLGLAETSRVAADLISTALFLTPSSILYGGSVSFVGVAGFLLVVSATIFLGWSAVSSWNAGGSRKATLCASLLYIAVFAIWGGTEARLLLYLARSPTWVSVSAAQGLLLDVPLYLLVACLFVLGLFVAFSEPEWQRSHQGPGRWRTQVAQAFLDDLAAHPDGSKGFALDHLTELARGEHAAGVAKALRDLFSYDPDRDRLIVLRWHDEAADTLLALSRRSDAGGAYYVLTREVLPGQGPGSGPGASPMASGAGADLWGRPDLCDPAAWMPVLRQQKGQGRLSRPSSEARDSPQYHALLTLLADPAATEARDLFHRVGWTKPSGAMLLVQLVDAAQQGTALVPEIETDGEYLEVELSRMTGHGSDASPFLGPWDLAAWHVVREVAGQGGSAVIQYRATPSGDRVGPAPAPIPS